MYSSKKITRFIIGIILSLTVIVTTSSAINDETVTIEFSQIDNVELIDLSTLTEFNQYPDATGEPSLISIAMIESPVGNVRTKSDITIAIEECIAKEEQRRIQEEEMARIEAEKVEKERLRQEKEAKGVLLGNFKITHYCNCNRCNGSYGNITALGNRIEPGTTIAVDPRVIPLGSTVYIEGYGYRIAQDTGGAIKGSHIDMAVNSHSKAMDMGVVYAAVYIK